MRAARTVSENIRNVTANIAHDRTRSQMEDTKGKERAPNASFESEIQNPECDLAGAFTLREGGKDVHSWGLINRALNSGHRTRFDG